MDISMDISSSFNFNSYMTIKVNSCSSCHTIYSRKDVTSPFSMAPETVGEGKVIAATFLNSNVVPSLISLTKSNFLESTGMQNCLIRLL